MQHEPLSVCTDVGTGKNPNEMKTFYSSETRWLTWDRSSNCDHDSSETNLSTWTIIVSNDCGCIPEEEEHCHTRATKTYIAVRPTGPIWTLSSKCNEDLILAVRPTVWLEDCQPKVMKTFYSCETDWLTWDRSSNCNDDLQCWSQKKLKVVSHCSWMTGLKSASWSHC